MTTELVPTETHSVVTIGLKTGRQIQFLARTLTVGHTSLSQQLQEIKWTGAQPSPMWFEIENVEYVLFDRGDYEPAPEVAS